MNFNLAVILSESARRAPDHPVAVFDGGHMTYRQLDQASDRLRPAWSPPGSSPESGSRCSSRTFLSS